MTTDFARLDPMRTIAPLPVAAIEQHGPHLPLTTDALINQGVVAQALHRLPPSASVLVLPAMTIGDSLRQPDLIGRRGSNATQESLAKQGLIAGLVDFAGSVVQGGAGICEDACVQWPRRLPGHAAGRCAATVSRQHMPQLHLPMFPGGATEITETLSFARSGVTVTYFHCAMPVFSHDQDDRASFRLIAAQMYVTCGAKQADIARAFVVPQITIKRAVKQYRADGIKGFFAPRVAREPSVLTAELLEQAQGHLESSACRRSALSSRHTASLVCVTHCNIASLRVPTAAASNQPCGQRQRAATAQLYTSAVQMDGCCALPVCVRVVGEVNAFPKRLEGMRRRSSLRRQSMLLQGWRASGPEVGFGCLRQPSGSLSAVRS